MTALKSFTNKVSGLLASAAIRGWMSTLEYKAAYYDAAVDPASPENHGQRIYIFWHEYILFPIYLRGHCNLTMLLSQHRDADVLSRTAYHLGFDFVRGSTYRGSVTALRELSRKGRTMNLAITPDGPRGPRRRLAQGAIYLSSRLGLPLVPMGFGYGRPWRLRSWDRFAIPKAGSRARAVIGPEMLLPSHLDRDGVDHYRRLVEAMLVRLTSEAETWAESGTRKENEVPLRRQTAPRLLNEDSDDSIEAHLLPFETPCYAKAA